jgi:cytochrome P450
VDEPQHAARCERTVTTREFRYDTTVPSFQDTLYDDYRWMRDHTPVYRDEVTGTYALTRHADVWDAVHDHSRFSSDVAEAQTLLPQMIYFDPPRHTAHRALVSRAFTPRRVADLEPMVHAIARELCDGLATRDEIEFQHEYAALVPSMVAGRLIGVPDELSPEFRRLTECFLEITDAAQFAADAGAIYGMFAELLAERRREPADDLMSDLIAAEIDGERLPEDELLGFCMLLILAGNDTTSSLIGNGFVLLDGMPVLRTELAADPSRWGAAIEEMLRLEAPVQTLPRTATVAVELHGDTIPAGSRVQLVWASANRDEREFDRPDEFDLRREPGRHLAFGHGAHFCLGANLARLEARAAFAAFAGAFPEARVCGPPERVTSIWARAHARIPVRLR